MTEQGKGRILIFAGAFTVLALVLYLFWPEKNQDLAGPQTEPGIEADFDQDTDTAQSDEKPAFDLVRISRGGTGVIAGRMAPGAVVELFANGEKVSSVTADENGEWVIILDEPLTAGSVELNLKATPPGGETPVEAEDVVVVSVPERENERFVERSENGVVAVLSPKSGDGASRVLQKPGGTAFAEVGESLRFDTIDYGAGQTVITGRGLPRVEVRLYLDGEFVGVTRVGDEGRWTMAFEKNIAAGEHRLRLDQTLSGGDVQLRIEQPFITGEPLDLATAESGVLVRPGNTLWQIARRLYGAGVRYTVIFRENSEQIADPDLIYPGQIFRLPNEDDEAQ